MIRFANLGRRDGTFEVTDEAVTLLRQLAQRNPDAFLPDLARSLGVLGSIQLTDEPAGAAVTFAEGVGLLTPYFTRLPAAFASLMASLAQDYLRACEAADAAPDEELLAPLLPYFGSPDEGKQVD